MMRRRFMGAAGAAGSASTCRSATSKYSGQYSAARALRSPAAATQDTRRGFIQRSLYSSSASGRFPAYAQPRLRLWHYLFPVAVGVAGLSSAYSVAVSAQEDVEGSKRGAITDEHHTNLPQGFIDELSSLLNSTSEKRFVIEQAERENHSKDASYHAQGVPDAVAFPKTTEEVQQIVLACSRYKVPIIPYGSGTSLEGHTIAEHGGITVDFTRYMNKVLKVHVEDMDVVVQPGLRREELNDYLKQYNLFFPLDPGPSASLGGMVGTSCSGTHAVRYGTMKENILRLSLKVVLPNGNLVKTGQRSKKSSAGYDLTHLFVGSEGTLGIVTEITLRLKRLPEKTAVAVCQFPTVHEAANTVIQAMQEGVQIGRVELIDELMIKAVNISAGMNEDEKPTLYFEFSGSPVEVEEQEKAMRRLSKANNGGEFRFAEGEKSEELWSARKNALWHSLALRPGADILITDVAVPISRLAECIDETKKDFEDSYLLAPLVGHVGDGNFHLMLLFDASNPKEVEEANRLNDRLVQRAIAMEGTCTGEHGVGTGKKKWLAIEKGPEAVELMKTIKRSMDPENIFNPGKIV